MLAKVIKLQTKNNSYDLDVYNCGLNIEKENPVVSSPLLTNSFYFGGRIDHKISLSFDVNYIDNYNLIQRICHDSIIGFIIGSYKISNISMDKFIVNNTTLVYDDEDNQKQLTSICIEFSSLDNDYIDKDFLERQILKEKIEKMNIF